MEDEIRSITVAECKQCDKLVMLGDKEHDAIIYNGITHCPSCKKSIYVMINGEVYKPKVLNPLEWGTIGALTEYSY